MHLTNIPRALGAFQQPLTRDEIIAVCHRAFGPAAHPKSAQELSGGECNTVYRIRLAGQSDVVLRVAPAHSAVVPWHEADLMRHEHAIQPYFAPIAPLLPQLIACDFTRQII